MSKKTFRWWLVLGLSVLIVNFFIGLLHFFKADFYYDTDIARDFLLLDDMLESKKISLIGGRSSISGVFHGPLYYWLVLPLFILFKGNPLGITIFWQLSYWLFLGSFYLIVKEITDNKKALLSTVLLSTLTVFIPFGFTHTVLANFLIMPLIYFVYRYVKESKLWQLISAVLLNGLIIQFQMAFGVPMFILLGIYTVFHIIKNKNYLHFLAGLLILLPLSTFIMFDLRHDFIQLKSVFNFLNSPSNAWEIKNYLNARLDSILNSFNILNLPIEQLRDIVSFGFIISLFSLLIKVDKKDKNYKVIFISLLVVFGFWIITIPFKDTVWPQYYKTFLPVVVFIIVFSLQNYFPKKIGNIIIFLIIVSNFFFNIKDGINYLKSEPISDEIHWKFYRKMANDIFQNSSGKKFGYYVFSPDQFAYQGKYAMKYFSKAKGLDVSPYKKESLTYLIISPNMSNNPWANEEYWRENQVNINRNPDESWIYGEVENENYSIKRYNLSLEEVVISSDPLLIDGIHFR